MRKWFGGLLALVLVGAGVLSALAAEEKKKKERDPVYTNAEKAGPDFKVQGEYQGSYAGVTTKIGAQVIAQGDGKFVVNLLEGGLPGTGGDGKPKRAGTAQTEDGKITVTGKGWSGIIDNGKFTGKTETGTFTLAHLVRKSKTLGEKPPKNAVVLFDGSSADEWEGGKLIKDDNGKLEGGKLLNNGIRSKKKFRDFKLHLEFRLPFMPKSRDQGRANSGVYLQDRYELQVLDSFGLKGENNECGGFYQQTAPSVNMCLPPLSWQTYDIEFKAARFDQEGKKIANAVATVYHNGVKIHDKTELKKETPGGKKEEDKPLGIQLQNHNNPVYFRNIWVVEMK